MTEIKEGVFAAPDDVRGMTELDRSRFNKTVTIPYVEVEKKKLNSVTYLLKPFLAKLCKFAPIRDVPENESVRHVLLNPDKVKSMDDLGPKAVAALKEVTSQDELQYKEFDLEYEHLRTEDIFRKVLPGAGLSGFSIIGHIIHLNLKEDMLPFKRLIGEVLLDKNQPLIKMVVNKVKNIENKFRVFPMEILANKDGFEDTQVEVRHGHCVFKFDFAKVYWNPRLNTEHDRVALHVQKDCDVFYDVFAGVGPFAVPIAKKKCRVLANDLNPDSYKCLIENAKINKVSALLTTYNLDGRTFITDVISKDIIEEWRKLETLETVLVRKYHIAMNLPAIATEFLDAFRGWLDDYKEEILAMKGFVLPTIHCYCFVKGVMEDRNSEVIKKVEDALKVSLSPSDINEIVEVRKVAPNKDMFRISFTLPRTVIFTQESNKRMRLN